ncbi:MAG TPA: 16S rRNA (guanine(527)-N(7))-methyltransferase RsmG [Candidatus Dormibacteraeota bacterium]|nr:16S rRNA (guanine(527)-N(7))-methyltransferase RsmG [Candidatus Dormibacteraeota bacterium]
MHSKIADYVRLLSSWPGLVAGPPLPLIEDSLVLLDHLQDARSLIDVGSGGGMPGIPLKIARPELRVTLLEADRRKGAFLVHAAARLGLEVDVVVERAETAAHGHLREAFDLAVSRALAPMPALVELCLPFVRVGGRLLAMKVEVEPAHGAIARLGGGTPSVLPAPSAARDRGRLVIVPKVAPTPPVYPRRPGLPARRPLR